MTNDDTPAAHGFRMPAEWEPHAATWLSWPHEITDWPGKFGPVQWVYTEIIKALTRNEPVNLIVPPGDASAKHALRAAGIDVSRVNLGELRTDRSWVRDSGPIFVVNEKGDKAALDWRFNAWAKYPNWTHDDQIPAFAAEACGVRSWRPHCRGWRVVLEGGSIDVNGKGRLLTTEECLLSSTQHRNPP
ncbi:MAG TPA: agmatine deiminase family protein, partial [Gemmataceae bacterium]|nr:agmatine deiminase family protein [Gemmataceae bacterium]